MELQKTTTEDLSASITTNENVNFIKQLYHINYLVSYPVTDIMLEGWESSIKELAPEISLNVVKKIIDRMKLGSIPHDHRKGIQNIFNGYLILLNEEITGISEKLNKFNQSMNDIEEIEYKKLLLHRKNLQIKTNKFSINKPAQLNSIL